MAHEYDLNDYTETQTEYAPLPAGLYHCEIVKAEFKDTKKGGEMLSLGFKVLAGASENRMIFTQLNLLNSNPVAQNIGRTQRGKLVEACGFRVDPKRDAGNYIGGVCMVKVKVVVDLYRGNGAMENEVMTFSAVQRAVPVNTPAPHVTSGAPTVNPFARQAT